VCNTDKEFRSQGCPYVVGPVSEPPLNSFVLSVDDTEHTGYRAGPRVIGNDSGKCCARAEEHLHAPRDAELLPLSKSARPGKEKFTEFKKREDFRGFLEGVLADQRPDAEIHVTVITTPHPI